MASEDDFKSLELKGITSINEELGRGAYGRVYAVKYCEMICAAKEVHALLVEGVGEAEMHRTIESFLRECHQCSTLRHPNIIQFLGIYYPPEMDGASRRTRLPVMVMEMMADSLTSFVDKYQKIPIQIKFSIVHDVSLGLCYLHNHHPPIVHRDLSPNNILLTAHHVAKISDLGVAKVIRVDSRRTMTKAPGTVDFMPPEVLDKSPVYGPPMDVFSFGGIILHTFNQQWPSPSLQVQFDPKTRKMIALSEVERRQEYLDKMIGEAEMLRSLVEACLDYDPVVRPSIVAVCERIRWSKDVCMKEFPQDFISLYQLAEKFKSETNISRNEIEDLRNKNEHLQKETELQKITIEQQKAKIEEMEKQQIPSTCTKSVPTSHTMTTEEEGPQSKLHQDVILTSSKHHVEQTQLANLPATNCVTTSHTMTTEEEGPQSKLHQDVILTSSKHHVEQTQLANLPATNCVTTSHTMTTEEEGPQSKLHQDVILTSSKHHVEQTQLANLPATNCVTTSHTMTTEERSQSIHQDIPPLILTSSKHDIEQTQLADLPATTTSCKKTTADGEGPILSQSKFHQDAPPLMPTLTSSKYHIKWTRLADLPAAMYRANVAVQGRRIYVTGGVSPNVNATHQVFVYEIDNDRWGQLPALDHYSAIPHIIGDKLTLIGGHLIATNKMTNKVSTFDQTKQSWVSYYPNLVSVRSQPGVVTHMEYAIVAGGVRGDDTTLIFILDDIEILNWAKDSEWKRISIHLPVPMWALQLTAFDDHLYVVGYIGANGYFDNHVYKLPVTLINSANQVWRTSTRWIEFPQNASLHSSLVIGLSSLLVVGGHDTSMTADIKMYDRNLEKWRKIDSLSYARCSTAVAAINNNAIVVIGGYTKHGSTSDCMSSSLTVVELGQVEALQNLATI